MTTITPGAWLASPGHGRSPNNTILPYKGEDSGEITNKLRDYKVTPYSKKSKN